MKYLLVYIQVIWRNLLKNLPDCIHLYVLIQRREIVVLAGNMLFTILSLSIHLRV